MTRARLAERLAARGAGRVLPASLDAESDSGAGPGGGAVREAAVLAPLIDRAGGMSVLLTRRAESLRDHPGQICFPGGRAAPGDRDPVDTALRETEEEIGLPRRRVEVMGRLNACVTGTGFRVAPVVGAISEPFALDELTLDAREVAEAFEVPLAFLLDPANRARRAAVAQGRRRTFWVIAYGDRYIWGATARIAVNMAEILGGER